ncbi:MAG TPA: hypothetical protein VFN21_06805 [Acidimicrobiales bacterium]|nr:hypothetical protein [Acidimicrobiales bacterium]
MQVPATASSSPLIRLAAAQVAAQCGLDYDRVEDVRMAVSESVRILIGAPGDEVDGASDAPRLDAVLTVGDRSLTIVVGLDGNGDGNAPGPDDDSIRILEATTTSFSIDAADQWSPVVTVHFDTGNASGAVRDRTPGREG